MGCGRMFVFLFCITAIFPIPSFGNSPLTDADMVGKHSPAFELLDSKGEKITSAQLFGRGKITVINFWGLRCSPCLEEIPHLNRLYETHQDQLSLLGVNVDGIPADFLNDQIRKAGLEIRYVVVPDPQFVLSDLFRMMATPLTIVIDQAGVVRYRHENYKPGDEIKIEEDVSRLLEVTTLPAK